MIKDLECSCHADQWTLISRLISSTHEHERNFLLLNTLRLFKNLQIAILNSWQRLHQMKRENLQDNDIIRSWERDVSICFSYRAHDSFSSLQNAMLTIFLYILSVSWSSILRVNKDSQFQRLHSMCLCDSSMMIV